jgi:hypothetical protein
MQYHLTGRICIRNWKTAFGLAAWALLTLPGWFYKLIEQKM